MENNRIQKLLLSEYCDFSDTVLIESPFAETTRDGRGLREVALGLTPSRLVIAADVFKNNTEFTCPPDLDPSIESFELVSVYPLEFVGLSIFRRRKRRTLKARLIDGRAKYYELGGMNCKSMFWALWCENVRNIIASKEDGSSLSETTAASSSSATTLYLLSSGVEIQDDRKNHSNRRTCRVWAHYGGGDDVQSNSWFRKDLYLGPSYDELAHGYYTPVPVRFAGASLEDLTYELRDATPKNLTCKKTCSSWPCSRNPLITRNKKDPERSGGLCDVLFTRERKKRHNKIEKSHHNDNYDYDCSSAIYDSRDNRETASETSGISPPGRRAKKRQKRKAGSPRKHQAGNMSLAPKLSRFGFGVGENCNSGLYLEPWEGDRDHFRHARSKHLDQRGLIESGVSIWEKGDDRRCKIDRRHPRRYGLATAAHFFHALGPWSVQPGERESVQRRRASSAVSIRRQPVEAELRLPVSKRQLATSVSVTSLDGRAVMSSSTRGRVVLFWTPEYWYRPRAAIAAYRELRRHLGLLRDFRQEKERCSGLRKTFFCRRKKSDDQGDHGESGCTMREERSSYLLARIFSSKDTRKKMKQDAARESGTTSQLRRLLKMDLRITVWDLDSSTLARQLTVIDRDLFQRIPSIEIDILITQRSSRNAPNIGAWIAFSHRVSCLTSSEILATKKLDMRTRIIARFINAADKCHDIGNFHSCRSILAGLQSPSIYRLRQTWSRLRTRHSIRYDTMERLCKMYKNTKSRSYRRAWKRCENRPPILPYVGDLLARILDEDDDPPNCPRWKNQSCYTQTERNSKIPVTAIIENACKKIVTKGISDKKLNTKNFNDGKKEREKLVERRRSIGQKILSLMKIGYAKSECPIINNVEMEVPLTLRERILARKFVARWRRCVLNRKILAEEEVRLREMDPRRRKIMRISNWLNECQRKSVGYNFPVHSLAWEFLLKARYREDRENFFISLKLEPSCG